MGGGGGGGAGGEGAVRKAGTGSFAAGCSGGEDCCLAQGAEGGGGS